MLKLKIITPKKVVLEEEVKSITAPGADGELTILPQHVPLFAMLQEGVVRIETGKDEESYFSIGGGYVETNGKEINLLVTTAYGQDEIDEKEVEKARAKAERLLKETKDEAERQQALSTLRRSMVDMKLLKKVKRRRRPLN